MTTWTTWHLVGCLFFCWENYSVLSDQSLSCSFPYKKSAIRAFSKPRFISGFYSVSLGTVRTESVRFQNYTRSHGRNKPWFRKCIWTDYRIETLGVNFCDEKKTQSKIPLPSFPVTLLWFQWTVFWFTFYIICEHFLGALFKTHETESEAGSGVMVWHLLFQWNFSLWVHSLFS